MVHFNHFPEFIEPYSETEVYVEYSEAIFKHWSDDSGQAVYAIEVPGSTAYEFEVAFNRRNNTPNVVVNFKTLSTIIPALGPGGTLDIGGWKHNGIMTFSLTGTSGKFAVFDASNWMQTFLPVWGARSLRYLCLPGSHDAGMSKRGTGTAFATDDNIITQHVNIEEQLKLGVRYLDLRIVISNGQFFTGHYSNIKPDGFLGGVVHSIVGWQGANGQSLDDIIKDVNRFTASHTELIVLQISHAINTDVGQPNYRGFTSDEWSRLMKKLTGINNRLSKPVADFTKLTLNECIGAGKSAVVIMIDGYSPNENEGFHPMSTFQLVDNYSDTNNYDRMKTDQLDKMRQAATNLNKCFLLSWILTQQGITDVTFDPILKMAEKANNGIGEAVAACTPTEFPNIFLIDGISKDVPLFDSVMKINKRIETA